MKNNRIKDARINSKLSAIEISKILGITRQAYYNYENGSRQADYDTLTKLSEIFNVTVDYLIGKSDDPNPPELVIPDILKDVEVAFHRGEFEDLTQYEIDRLAEFAKFLKSQRDEEEEEM